MAFRPEPSLTVSIGHKWGLSTCIKTAIVSISPPQAAKTMLLSVIHPHMKLEEKRRLVSVILSDMFQTCMTTDPLKNKENVSSALLILIDKLVRSASKQNILDSPISTHHLWMLTALVFDISLGLDFVGKVPDVLLDYARRASKSRHISYKFWKKASIIGSPLVLPAVLFGSLAYKKWSETDKIYSAKLNFLELLSKYRRNYTSQMAKRTLDDSLLFNRAVETIQHKRKALIDRYLPLPTDLHPVVLDYERTPWLIV
jgi:hypothetical protein